MYHFPLVPRLIERHGWKAGSPAFYHWKIPQKIRADVLDWHLWPSVLHTGVRSTKAEYTLEYPLYYHLQLQLPRWNVSSAAFVMERCTWFWYVSPLRLRLFPDGFWSQLDPRSGIQAWLFLSRVRTSSATTPPSALVRRAHVCRRPRAGRQVQGQRMVSCALLRGDHLYIYIYIIIYICIYI